MEKCQKTAVGGFFDSHCIVIDCLLKFDRHNSLIVHNKSSSYPKVFSVSGPRTLYKAYCVYVRLKLLEYYSSVVAAPQDSGG